MAHPSDLNDEEEGRHDFPRGRLRYSLHLLQAPNYGTGFTASEGVIPRTRRVIGAC